MKIGHTKWLNKLCLLSLVCVASPIFALSPPWHTIRSKVKTALEADSCVEVSPVTGRGQTLKMTVSVCEYNKAYALATFITKAHTFGNIALETEVLYQNQIVKGTKPKTIQEAQELLNTALKGNPYFVKVDQVFGRAFLEFTPTVVQYYTDDISDFYGRTTLVSAKAFDEVLNLDSLRNAGLMISTTTSPVK